ncbi:hypothetical protein Lfu02_40490 [Longispora fulva]|nr:hypothetical protein Lfu02_40490 [Longispora fulva]
MATAVLTSLLVAPAPASAATTDDGTRLVAVTDQATHQIRLFDPKVTDWSAPGAERWDWKPTTSNGFLPREIQRWGVPTDVKLRKDDSGGYVAVVSDSLGLAALIDYPSGFRRWATDATLGGTVDANPHSVELLPGNIVAVAASTGGFVQLFRTGSPPSPAGPKFVLPGAHGVYWDPDRQVLWATADHDLVELKLDRMTHSALVEVGRTRLVTPSGHDLAPKLGDPDHLWVSTDTAAYLYDKNSGHFTLVIDAGLKSISSMPLPNGEQVRTRPQPAWAGDPDNWNTDTVEFGGIDGPTRVVPNGRFYKARVWSSQRA